jgi:thymidylate synthase (FAD)
MNIVRPSYEILDDIDGTTILRKLELCGRTAYKSEAKIDSASAAKFIRALIDRGHESVIEHVAISVKFICDRGVTHELVRHRLVSYTQESTRYCNYSKLGVTFVEPPWGLTEMDKLVLSQMEEYYNTKIKLGQTPQQARYFLPNGLKTEIVATANLREWRHILKLRTHSTAHPQMREVMQPLLEEFKARIPIVFDDIASEE